MIYGAPSASQRQLQCTPWGAPQSDGTLAVTGDETPSLVAEAAIASPSNATHNCSWVEVDTDSVLASPEGAAANGLLSSVRSITSDAEVVITFVGTIKEKFFGGSADAPQLSAAALCINATQACLLGAPTGGDNDPAELCGSSPDVISACGGEAQGGADCAPLAALCVLDNDAGNNGDASLAHIAAACEIPECLASGARKAAVRNASVLCDLAATSCLDAAEQGAPEMHEVCDNATQLCGSMQCRSVAAACAPEAASRDVCVASIVDCILLNETATGVVVGSHSSTAGAPPSPAPSGGVFGELLAKAFGGPLQSALTWVQGVWARITNAFGGSFADTWDDILGAVESLSSVWATLSDFSSIEDSLMGVQFIADAKRSLESIMTTLSKVGKVIAGAVKGGAGNVASFVGIARRAYDSVSQLTVASALSVLPTAEGTRALVGTIAQFAPTAQRLGTMVLRMLHVLPPAGENTTVDFPWLSAMTGKASSEMQVTGTTLAGLLGVMRKLPPVTQVTGQLADASDFLGGLNASLSILGALYDAGLGVADAAGAKLTELSASDATAPLAFMARGGVAKTVASASTSLLTFVVTARDAFSSAQSLLQTWADDLSLVLPELAGDRRRRLDVRRPAVRRLVATADAAARFTALKGVLASAVALADALFADVRAVVAAMGDWEGVGDALGVCATLASSVQPGALAHVIGKVRLLVGHLDSLKLLPGDWFSWIDTSLSLLDVLLPKVSALASPDVRTAFDAVRESALGGVLSTIDTLEGVLLAAAMTVDVTLDTLSVLSDTAVALTPAQLALKVALTQRRLSDSSSLLSAAAGGLSNATELRAALDSAGVLAQGAVHGAQVVVLVRQALSALPPDIVSELSALIEQVKDVLPSGVSNVLLVAGNVGALKESVEGAEQIYWALVGGAASVITAALHNVSSVATDLQSMVGNITTVDTLYRIAASLVEGVEADIGVVDVSGRMDVASPAARATVLADVGRIMALADRAAELLTRVRADAEAYATGELVGRGAPLSTEITSVLAQLSSIMLAASPSFQQTIEVVDVFLGYSFTHLGSIIADVAQAQSPLLDTVPALGSLATFSLALLPIDGLGSGAPASLRALLAVAEIGTAAFEAASALNAVDGPAVSLSDDSSRVLAALPGLTMGVGGLASLLAASKEFYSSDRDADSAERLVATLDLALSPALEAIAPLNGTAAALEAALAALVGFLASADSVVRLRASLRLDNATALDMLTNAPSSFSELRTDLSLLLETFGLSGAEVMEQSDLHASRAAFTHLNALDKLGEPGVTSALQQVQNAVDAVSSVSPSLTLLAGITAAVAQARDGLREAGASLPTLAAADLEPSALDALVAAAASSALVLDTAVQAAQLVAVDMLARAPSAAAAGPPGASDAGALGRLALVAADSGAALELALETLNGGGGLTGVCSAAAALGDAAGLAAFVGDAKAPLVVFEAPLVTFLGAMLGAIDAVAVEPGLTDIAGELSAARELFTSLSSVAGPAAAAAAATLPDSLAIENVDVAVAQLCSPLHGAAPLMRAGAKALGTIRALYLAADTASGPFVLAPETASAGADLAALLVPLGSLASALADSGALASSLGGLKDVYAAAVSVASVPPRTLELDAAAAGLAQASTLTANLGPLLDALGSSSGAVQVFLEGAQAVRRIAASADALQAIYERIGSSSAAQKLWCVIQRWLSPAGASAAPRSLAETAAWAVNGHAAVPPAIDSDAAPWPLVLTKADGTDRSAGSAFVPVTISPSGFTARFQWRMTRGGSAYQPGEGLVFLLHRDPRGAAALGGWAGGCMAYCGIAPSLGVRFDALDGAMATSSAGVVAGGALGPKGEWNVQGVFLDQWYGSPVDVTVAYSREHGGTRRVLNVTITKRFNPAAAGATNASHSFVTSGSALPDLFAALACVDGALCDGYMGFTAGTGVNVRSTFAVLGLQTDALGAPPPPALSRSSSRTPTPSSTLARPTSPRSTRSSSGTHRASGTRTRSGASRTGAASRTRTASASHSRAVSRSRATTRAPRGSLSASVSGTASRTRLARANTGAARVTPSATASGLLLDVPSPLAQCGVSSPIGSISSLFDNVKSTFLGMVGSLKSTFNATRSANGTLAAVTVVVNSALDRAEGALDKVAELADAAESFSLLKNLSSLLTGGGLGRAARWQHRGRRAGHRRPP